MSELTIIQKALPHHAHLGPHSHVRLPASRTTLAKRRWRGTAENGKEFGFDVESPLVHGTYFYAEGTTHYVIEQTPEEVLEIPFATIKEAAHIAWNLGNLHFGLQILEGTVRVLEDSAVLQFLSREHINFHRTRCVFLPLSTGSHHHHELSHHHHG